MSLDPATYSKILHGFWHSNGVALPKGPVLTLSASTYKLFTSAIALLISWAASRLYHIFAVIIFHSVFKQYDSKFENRMAAVMVVNIQSPWSGVTSTIRRLWRLRRMKVFFCIFAASLSTFLLVPAVVVWLSFLPSYSEGLLISNNCGLAPIRVPTDKLFAAYNARRTQWADAALRDVDGNETDTRTDIKATPPAALPTPSQSYILECPTGAPACSIEFPFTFTSNYTLHSKHFGLDTDMPFSLHVSDTCFRPRGASAQLPIDIPGDPKQYGLFYGPSNFSSVTADGKPNFLSTPYTEALYEGQEFRPGYRLSQYAARVDDFLDVEWSPNSTLLLGGDTTITFYYIGGTAMVKPSSDPLFATEPSLTLELPTGDVLYRSPIVTPIVCDTKYQFCTKSRNNCSPFGGMWSLSNWLRTNGQPDLSAFFSASVFRPPIYQASLGSGAVTASQTAPGGLIQLAPDNATARRELDRLVRAGMVMLASYLRLSASGYWDVGLGSQSLSPATSSLLCDRVIIETKNSISIPLTPYIVLLFMILVVAIVSYADWYLKTDWCQNHATNWAIHRPGPMLRRLTEVIRKTDPIKVSPTDNWGLAESGILGPDIIELDGAKRFGLASPVFSNGTGGSDGDAFIPHSDVSPSSASVTSNVDPPNLTNGDTQSNLASDGAPP